MGVRIVLDGPRPRRAGRAAAVAASVPLILVGVVGLIGLVYLVALQLTDSFRGSDKTTAALYTAWCAVAAFVGLWLGLQLLRGRRRLVLFLRRFGYADATKALSFAATNAIGGSWRLVTLDDDMVQGIGGSTAPRKASGAGTLFVLAAVGVFVWWFMRFGADMFLDDWMSSATVSPGTGSDGLDGIGKALGGAMVLGLVVFILMWLLIALVGVSVPLLLFSYFKARRAERALTERIRLEREIPGRVSKMARKSSKILSPRLTVVTVAHAVWRQAVVGFAHASGVVIIDVTIPSDALRWEIQTLLPALGGRCVLVGRLEALTRTLPNGRTVMDSPLAHDIDGHEILAYRADPQGLRRFAKALRGTIESRAASR
ncbi:hypothetical protein SK803_12700 [Lentzea sp. BCCO 10_0856]|uniref:Uncharacterized protein n=1 Tax=Lentzea miocenica TaxID=3095431 RepID=A0ABU4SYU2_9PSEU|nr:hypothetical protein [Lentzea sp. BCCO 10_0856]MDX8031079.1 hypothetical protein [Lentzea sp. BCCO 10_0856]